MNLHYFRFDYLANFVGLFIGIFTLLVVCYSFGFMRGGKGSSRYFLYILLTLVSSLGAVYANHLILFIVYWGFSGLLLYLLIGFGQKEHTPYTAKKAFMIIGGADALMLLGLALVFYLSRTWQMDKIRLALDNRLAVYAYLCLALGAFAKAGAMPLHTWVPDTAEDAPTPVTAYLPAALDKLLGIYFLARISLEMFQMDKAMNTLLMAVGSITIVAAVMMALIQHDLKRLLGYQGVSQVGYMVLGIGTGNPVGIAGGVFHMLNHAIYKSCLFLSSGSVEKRSGKTDLERLGGLARVMPVTFLTFLTAALAISGVPPFNGFASKWMVYQGVIEAGKSGGYLWVVWLLAAFFGSALTLASFMKLVHTVFLGQPSDEVKVMNRHSREVSVLMWLPQVVLALLCVLFGVFAYRLPLKMFILPSLGLDITFAGIWQPNIATALLLSGIIIGIIIYLFGRVAQAKETEVFVGGELLKDYPKMRVSGIEFYNTIKELGILRNIYRQAERGFFDIYEQGKNFVFTLGRFLQELHNGILPTYLVWTLLGMLGLFWVLLK